MNFVMSYSGGKDSALALYRSIKYGHNPIALLTTCNEDIKSSWFHNIPYEILEKISKSLGIPLVILNTDAENYTKDFENELLKLKKLGAEMCVFGDIDIKEHFDWGNQRCLNSGIKSSFPLWNEKRKDLVIEFIDLGFEALITVIDSSKIREEYLGKVLTRELIEKLENDGVDVCGENGEYHTLTINGTIFKEKINFKHGEKLKKDNYLRIPILYDETNLYN